MSLVVKRKHRLQDDEFRDLGSLPIPLDANYGLVVEPRLYLMGGKQDNNAVPLKMDSSGHLFNYQWWGGSTVAVNGTYTDRTAGNTNGIITITPASGDELIPIYGMSKTATKATAGAFEFLIEDSSGEEMGKLAKIANAGANNRLVYNFAPTAAPNTDNAFLGLWYPISGGDRFKVWCKNMANTETFVVRLRFRSLLGSDPTVAATGGTWA